MNWIKKAKAALLALVMTVAFGAASADAAAYTYNDTNLGVTMELDQQPRKVQASGNAAQLLWEDKAIIVKVMPQQQPKEELDAYLAKTDTEIKQQLSAYQKDYGIRLVDAYWIKDGKYPIQYSEAYNKGTYMAVAIVLTDKTVCTVRRFSPNKLLENEREAFITALKTVTLTK